MYRSTVSILYLYVFDIQYIITILDKQNTYIAKDKKCCFLHRRVWFCDFSSMEGGGGVFTSRLLLKVGQHLQYKTAEQALCMHLVFSAWDLPVAGLFLSILAVTLNWQVGSHKLVSDLFSVVRRTMTGKKIKFRKLKKCTECQLFSILHSSWQWCPVMFIDSHHWIEWRKTLC